MPRGSCVPGAPRSAREPSRDQDAAAGSVSRAHRAAFRAGLPSDCRGRWESFVEETLTEANRRNAVDLVSRPQAGRAERCPHPGPCPTWARWTPGARGLVRPAWGGWVGAAPDADSCPPTLAVAG